MKEAEKAISFLPTPVIPWIESGKPEVRFNAVVAFADVSGFTRMSAQLSSIGKEGGEALTGILNQYFTEMIERIHQVGGFVGKFGGDAMTIFFPVESDSDEAMKEVGIRAIRGSLDLQAAMEQFRRVETKAGVFTLEMKIGVACGPVLFRVVGEAESDKDYLLAGYPLDRAAEAEHHGIAGDVIVTPKLSGYTSITGELLDDGFHKLRLETTKLPPVRFENTLKINPAWAELARNFIDPAVYQRLALGIDSVGEIRRVSVIFMSFSGLDYDVDPDVGKKLEVLYDWIYGLTRGYNGSINKIDMGDKGSKFLLTFGTPTAHENDEELAVMCGLELVQGKDEVREFGIEQRLGIATGVVFAGEVGAPARQEYTVMGPTVNLAARLMAHSRTGQLLVDPSTYERVESRFEFSKPELVTFKGIPEPMPVCQVLGFATQDKNKITSIKKAFIGRKDELRSISAILKGVNDGNSRVLVLRGDAGNGKSRLVEEIHRRYKDSGFLFAGGEALSYGKRSPYLVWISILRRLMGLSPAGGGTEALRIITEQVHLSDPEHEYRVPIIAKLLGIKCKENDITRHFDAQLRQENLFDFIVLYLKYKSQQNAAVLVFEDSQWIDRNSLELMSYVLRNSESEKILLLISRRSYSRNFTSPHIGEIEGSEKSTTITIKEFDRTETELLISSELNVSEIEPELMEFIFDSSHGNPSFTEQLLDTLKSLDKIGVVPCDVPVRFRAERTGDLSEVEVPDSLSSLIMSQLDRLSPEAKLTVKLSAVIGRRFAEELVNRSYPVKIDDREVKQSLSELESLELINKSDEKDFYDYIFKNLLTQNVAYDSLLFAHRREYHRRIGVCLESMHEDSLSEWVEDLARHFYQSDDDQRAGKYQSWAGDKAFELYANESAEIFYQRALERTDAELDPDRRFEYLKKHSNVCAVIGNREDQKSDLDEALALAGRQNNNEGQVLVLANLVVYFQRIYKLDKMKETIDRANEVLSKIDYPLGKIRINSKAGNWFYIQNKFQDALQCWQDCLKEAEVIADQASIGSALTNCGLAYKALGDFNSALEHYNHSVKIDRKTGNKKSEAVNLGNIGVLYHQRGEYEEAMRVYEQALEIGRSIGSKTIQSWYLGNLASIYQAKGDRKKALEFYVENLQIARQMGYLRDQVLSLCNISGLQYENANYSESLSHGKRALDIAVKAELKRDEPSIYINLGLTHHYTGDLETAIEEFRKAVEISVEVKNKLSEEYARRYLGFALIDREQIDEASVEFKNAKEIATAVGSKVGIASAKIGEGWIGRLKGETTGIIEEGVDEARQVGDTETVVKGLVAEARISHQNEGQTDKAIELLNTAEETARASGLMCDVLRIQRLISELQPE